ncbi:MAG: MFS transporter [Lachnospiraceae bacterium]|nr:MFS transporter [Lachnospiraceae bacterium]MDY4968933.1 MFS transporter [Lachnospiraceae bacterium]
MRKNYTYTIYACYIGYVVQAIINNLAPLLFLTFNRSFHISMEQIGLLISINFGVQILVDWIAARYVDKVGYRFSILLAHVCSVIGLISLGVLPFLIDPYCGLVLAMVCNAIGGGLIEVLVSPIVEAAPSSSAKEAAMSLLHSFYCWGHVAVVLLSTLGFRVFGMDRWYMLPVLWSIVPALNIILFSRVPINTLVEEEEKLPAKQLLSMKMFWLFFVLMICAGASEQAMSQWASLFAEEGLKQSKTVGDLLGPCMFAVLMGCSRMFYGKFGEKINLRKFMLASGSLCVVSYLLAIFMKNPLLALLGCGLCGLSVGIMWPGTFSISARLCPQGGTLMFALLALAGDVGCASGPAVVSFISGVFPQYGIKAGLAAAIIFPAVLICLLVRNRKTIR